MKTKNNKINLIKNKLAVLLLLFFVVLLGGCNIVYSSSSNIELEVDNGYSISAYHIDVVVNENNSYNITETLKVDFGSYSQFGPSRGIYRYIPYKQNISVYNEETQTEIVKEYNVKLNIVKAYETNSNTSYNLLENENGNTIIRIQEDQLVNGKTREYRYEYTYDIGYDRIEFKDFMYFNLLGYDINTIVNNFTFKITLPKGFEEFDNFSPQPNFYIGKYSESNTPSEHVSFLVNENVLQGSVNKTLQPFEAVTINLDLPNNYFNQVTKPSNTLQFIIIGLILIVAIVVIMLSMLLNKNKQIVSPVEFYPPNDMDSVLMSYTITGQIGMKKMTSLVIYFASKGYLNIIEDNKKLSLQKVKDLNKDAPAYQHTVFNALFENSENEKTTEVKTSEKGASENDDSANKNTNPIIPLSKIEKTAGQHLYGAQMVAKTSFGQRINKTSILHSLLIMLISVIPALAFGAIYSYNIGSDERLIPLMFLIILTVLIYFVGFRTSKQIYFNKVSNIAPFIAIIVAIIIAFVTTTVFNDAVLDPYSLKYFMLMPAVIAACVAPKVLRLNDDYFESFGRVLGFRKTLLLTEKKRMEVLLKDDPSYFYNILPYAYVLDITDEFSKKFEGLAMQKPNWYYTNNTTVFDIIIFNRLLTMSLTNFSARSMTAIAPKSGGRIGGGGFGGGFSGGGFGGGGIGRA